MGKFACIDPLQIWTEITSKINMGNIDLSWIHSSNPVLLDPLSSPQSLPFCSVSSSITHKPDSRIPKLWLPADSLTLTLLPIFFFFFSFLSFSDLMTRKGKTYFLPRKVNSSMGQQSVHPITQGRTLSFSTLSLAAQSWVNAI